MSILAEVFQDFLQKNIIVTIVVLAVLLVRLLLQKFPKKYSYVLWGFVGIRMIFDGFVSSGISLFNLVERAVGGGTVSGGVVSGIGAGFDKGVHNGANMGMNIGTNAGTNVGAAITGDNPTVGGNLTTAGNPTAEQIPFGWFTWDSVETVLAVLAIFWLAGMLAILVYGIYSYVKCRRLVFQAVKLEGNVWECDTISSPFVLGIWSPQIYIPFGVEEAAREYILTHERCHIRRRDYLTKLLAFCLLAIYWVNPFVWVAFYLMSRDMEMSCDEAVLRTYGNDIKKIYSTSLLHFAEERVRYSFAPIAFGEADAGKRIKNVLRFQKPKVWLTALVLLLVCVFGAACLTNAEENAGNDKNVEAAGEDSATNDGEGIGSDSQGINNQNGSNTKPDSAENATQSMEEINAALREVYMNALQRLVNLYLFPNDQRSDGRVDNYYKIMDVDGDGRIELILNYPNASATAGMIYYIFDYDLETSQFRQELAAYPAVQIYDNGIVIAESSHNHGRSSLDDFWPYNLYRYHKETDTYEHITWVDAWEYIRYKGAEPDEEFPTEKDVDGDGVLYYTVDENFEPDKIMDNEEYGEWTARLAAGASLLQIEYDKLPVEESTGKMVWENRYLDMDGNGVEDYVSVRMEKEGEEYLNIVTVWLDDGTKREVKYPGNTGWWEDLIMVKNARLRYPDKDSLVLGFTDSTSAYCGTDVHVLSIVGEGEGAELVEELTVLDGGSQSPQYERYQSSVYELDASITHTPGEDSVKYMVSLGSNAILVREADDSYRSDERRFYFYWKDEEWKLLEVVPKEREDTIPPIYSVSELQIDLDGDGENEGVYVCDYKLDERSYTRLIANVGDGVVIKDYEGAYVSSLRAGDLTGDGKPDILLKRFIFGSTYGAVEPSLLYYEDGAWQEYLKNFIPNPNISMEQPERFGDAENWWELENYIEAILFVKDGKQMVRFVALEPEDRRKDTVIVTDASYREEGWYIENREIVHQYYSEDNWKKVLNPD